MQLRFVLSTAVLCSTGCLDLATLQSGGTGDMSTTAPHDMAMVPPPPDMVKIHDMVKPDDLTMPDLMPPYWVDVSPATAPKNLYAIAGTVTSGSGTNSVTTIYAVGQSATVLKWASGGSGSTFSAGVNNSGEKGDYTALWLDSAMAVYMADSLGDVWETSDGATNANNWTDLKTGAPAGQHAIYGQSGGTGEVLVGGDSAGDNLYLNPLTLTLPMWMAAGIPGGKKVLGIWAGTSNFIAVGDMLTAAKTPSPLPPAATMPTWTTINNNATGNPSYTAVSGSADNDVWVVTGDGQLLTVDLTVATGTLSKKTNKGGGNFTGVWVKSATEVWIVDNGGAVYEWNGTTLLTMTQDLPGGYALTGIWGDGNGGLWITGNKGANGAIFKH
jgi:hypothetical protein